MYTIIFVHTCRLKLDTSDIIDRELPQKRFPFISSQRVTNLICRNIYIQVIKNIRNVTRHRNGQSVKSRQTRWEWQLLISIMHIHDVVTHYNNYAFLCACHVNSTVFFALPPCCVVESYSRVCVLVDDHTIFYFNHRRDKVILHFCFRQCVSQCH